MKYRAVIVSPHLDDAVFSCGAQIAHLVSEGPVLVLNLFTEFPETVKSNAVVLGPERYEEERKAAEFLGFESRNLGEIDAACRRPEYRSLGNIFRPPVAADTGEYLTSLRQKIFDILAAIDFDYVYVPLAIGWHVDHVLTFRILEPWIGRDCLRYYEDTPYCLIPSATQYRLNDIGVAQADAKDQTLVSNGLWRDWLATTGDYAQTALMKNLQPALVRWAAVPVVGAYFLQLLWQHRRVQSEQPPMLAVTTVDVSAALDQKIDAMRCYDSQFREFFMDSRDCERMLTAYARRAGQQARGFERYWSIKPCA